MMLVLVFVIMMAVIIKQKGYIKSTFESLTGYDGAHRSEIRWKTKPLLEEHHVTIHMQTQKEQPS